MHFDKSRLLDFLETLDNEMTKRITIVAVGGTAMTILDLKTSTIDIDFTVPSSDYQEFEKALKSVPHGFKVDVWQDGMIFSQILPSDYLEKSIEIVTTFEHIHLRALQPVDIVITKIGRLDERDLQDIEACIKRFGISKIQIEERASNVQYVGREENYLGNLKYVVEKFF
jgi:predicted nucleotidyltransferase component of viral defense system